MPIRPIVFVLLSLLFDERGNEEIITLHQAFGKNYEEITEMMRAIYSDNARIKHSFLSGLNSLKITEKTPWIVSDRGGVTFNLICCRKYWSCAVCCP